MSDVIYEMTCTEGHKTRITELQVAECRVDPFTLGCTKDMRGLHWEPGEPAELCGAVIASRIALLDQQEDDDDR